MAVTIKHAKTDTIADWTQADLDAQIALGNFPPGTLLADIVLPSDWNNDHTISGTLAIANGGTGQTTANAALNALLPSQSSQSGKVLSTDGTNTSWIAASGTGTVTSVSVTSANGFAGTVANATTTPAITLSTSVTGLLKGNGTAISAATSGTDYAPATSGTSILYGNGAGGFSNVTVGSGLSFSTGTLSATGGGSGDVIGPASATDNAITRFDGTTGKLIQNSTVTLSDTGALSGINSIVTPDYITYDTTATGVSITPGVTTWNDGEGTLDLGLKGGNVTLNVGTQEYARVYNDSGSTLTKGQVVYISGAQGNRVAVKLARADVEATSFGTIGLVAESITNGSEGYIIVSGALSKINTTGLTAGASVYLSPTTAGAITTTKPQAPDQLVVLGWVERVDNTVGSIYVKIDNGYELDELHDVQITSPTSGNMLIYDASTSPIGVWKNANLTAGTGISITNGAGSVTVTNSAPDQTVAITGAGGAVVTGTYPNFTITTPSGTVTSVTATSPVTSTGGATPVIAMPAATTSVSGYLTSTDWNTFNGKGNGTVTSVAALTLGTTGTDLSSSVATGTTTPVITLNVPTASATNRGVLSSTDWTTFNNKGSGTVTSVSGTGSVNGITLTGTVTSTGSLTLGGTLGSIANSQLTNSSVTVNGTAIALGASGTVTATATNALTIGSGLSGTSYNGSTAVTIANSAPMTYPTGSGIAVVSSGTSWGTTLTAPSGTIVGTSDTQTLTNKRVTPRVSTTTSSATPTINTDTTDQFGLTALAVNITSFTTNLSGTPTDGQKLWIYIVGTAARTITWGASFEASTVALPTTTVSTNRLDVGFVWNAATSKWRCVAVA